MHRHGRVEISFRRAHFDGDAKKLRHLPGIVAEDVNAQNFIGLSVHNDFHPRFVG